MVGNTGSHPMWVRGLKPALAANVFPTTQVAPYVGAWIETGKKRRTSSVSPVAPYVGAWIETCR